MGQLITGVVSSDKTDKTIVVVVAERKTHPLYKKQYTMQTKFMAHDEKNEAKIGDKVAILPCRPLSARKRFRLSKIVERGGVRFEETDATADIPDEPKVEVKSQPVKAEKKTDEPKAKKAKPKKEAA